MNDHPALATLRARARVERAGYTDNGWRHRPRGYSSRVGYPLVCLDKLDNQVGRDNATLTEPTSSHATCLKTRRLPPACPDTCTPFGPGAQRGEMAALRLVQCRCALSGSGARCVIRHPIPCTQNACQYLCAIGWVASRLTVLVVSASKDHRQSGDRCRCTRARGRGRARSCSARISASCCSAPVLSS